MEVSDERGHDWDVVLTVGFGGGWRLWWWLRLGVWQEVESPDLCIFDFSPSVEKHFYVRAKDCDWLFVLDHRAAFVTKGNNAHDVVAEVVMIRSW